MSKHSTGRFTEIGLFIPTKSGGPYSAWGLSKNGAYLYPPKIVLNGNMKITHIALTMDAIFRHEWMLL